MEKEKEKEKEKESVRLTSFVLSLKRPEWTPERLTVLRRPPKSFD
jgi:hypothetical protein